MTALQRARTIAAACLASTALAGCGPSAQTNASSPPAAAANSAVAHLPAPGAAVALLPPMPDSDRDSRPSRAKSDDFAAHLERIQANMTAVDAGFIARVRSAVQTGSQADVRQLLTDYRDLIASDTAALPAAPHLSGCYAKALAPNARAESAIAAMLSDRRDKADAIAAVADRPLTLPDFGGLAADIAAGAANAEAGVASARASVAGCRADE